MSTNPAQQKKSTQNQPCQQRSFQSKRQNAKHTFNSFGGLDIILVAFYSLYPFGVDDDNQNARFSCPVILAKGPRSGHAKVAVELCEKSYNFSLDEWYYGVNLHAFVSRRTGHLPTPLALMVSGSAVNDLTAAKQIVESCLPLNPG